VQQVPPPARARARCQGLTFVHFSAQQKPFWSHLPVCPCLIDWGKSCTRRIQQNVLTLSRKVDECKPLPVPIVAPSSCREYTSARSMGCSGLDREVSFESKRVGAVSSPWCSGAS
jgi:hypothetical protein